MKPVIRRAVGDDCKKILKLLSEVEAIHQKGRPDIFRVNGTKFTEDELVRMFTDDTNPISWLTLKERSWATRYACSGR